MVEAQATIRATGELRPANREAGVLADHAGFVDPYLEHAPRAQRALEAMQATVDATGARSESLRGTTAARAGASHRDLSAPWSLDGEQLDQHASAVDPPADADDGERCQQAGRPARRHRGTREAEHLTCGRDRCQRRRRVGFVVVGAGRATRVLARVDLAVLIVVQTVRARERRRRRRLCRLG